MRKTMNKTADEILKFGNKYFPDDLSRLYSNIEEFLSEYGEIGKLELMYPDLAYCYDETSDVLIKMISLRDSMLKLRGHFNF